MLHVLCVYISFVLFYVCNKIITKRSTVIFCQNNYSYLRRTLIYDAVKRHFYACYLKLIVIIYTCVTIV